MMLSQTTLLEVIKALVADELKSIRRLGTHELPTDEWNADTLISASRQSSSPTLSLQADSLEWLALAGRVMQFFNLQDSGYEDYLLRYKTLGEWAELVAIARNERESTTAITFQTSGSTGKPKAVQHDWDNLVAEAETFKSYFEMLFEPPQSQPITRVIALCPSHHIYGFLFTALLPELIDAQNTPVLRGFKAFSTVQAGALRDGDLIIGLPHMWQQLQRSGTAFNAKVIGVSSTGPCSKDVIAALKSQGLNHFVEIYGSTETGGVGVRRNAKQGFELLPRWNRSPDLDTQIEQTEPVAMLVDVNTNQKVHLCDRLEWLNQRQFIPVGRIDNAVQVGGINVFPDQVAAQLESHPAVAKAAVRLMQEDEGERLKAFVVPAHPHANPEQLIEALEQWCQEHLPAVATPKQYKFGDQLPRNELGKIGDWT